MKQRESRALRSLASAIWNVPSQAVSSEQVESVRQSILAMGDPAGRWHADAFVTQALQTATFSDDLASAIQSERDLDHAYILICRTSDRSICNVYFADENFILAHAMADIDNDGIASTRVTDLRVKVLPDGEFNPPYAKSLRAGIIRTGR